MKNTVVGLIILPAALLLLPSCDRSVSSEQVDLALKRSTFEQEVSRISEKKNSKAVEVEDLYKRTQEQQQLVTKLEEDLSSKRNIRDKTKDERRDAFLENGIAHGQYKDSGKQIQEDNEALQSTTAELDSAKNQLEQAQKSCIETEACKTNIVGEYVINSAYAQGIRENHKKARTQVDQLDRKVKSLQSRIYTNQNTQDSLRSKYEVVEQAVIKQEEAQQRFDEVERQLTSSIETLKKLELKLSTLKEEEKGISSSLERVQQELNEAKNAESNPGTQWELRWRRFFHF